MSRYRLTPDQIAKRWERLTEVGQRHARHTYWWDLHIRGDRSARVLRMKAFNTAANRTDRLYFNEDATENHVCEETEEL